jgi:hypothetical protein
VTALHRIPMRGPRWVFVRVEHHEDDGEVWVDRIREKAEPLMLGLRNPGRWNARFRGVLPGIRPR